MNDQNTNQTKESTDIKTEETPLHAETSMPIVSQEPLEVEVVDDEVKEKAGDVVEDVVTAFAEYRDSNSVITTIGSEELSEMRQLSKVLEAPVKDIMGEAGSPQDTISNSLLEIKSQADAINPAHFDLNPGFFGRLIAKITGSSAMNKYVTKYTSTADVIKSISESLDGAILKLKEDNAIFEQDKARFRKASDALKNKVQLLMAVDQEVEKKVEAETDPDKKSFLQEEVLFTIRSHTQDLQQTYIASQQGVAAINVLIKNNRELIRGVERTQRVAIPVMSIGFTIATGLASQKKILDLTDNINQATADTMVQNSKMLKDQGAAIQKQAASATLDIQKVTQSMEDLIAAIEDVETFKQAALPGMKESVNALQALSETVDAKVEKMEKGEKYKLEQAKQLEGGSTEES
jgi:uncharacterized protein YaaN involved in tellurite resistance